jgi:hypothetical protein
MFLDLLRFDQEAVFKNSLYSVLIIRDKGTLGNNWMSAHLKFFNAHFTSFVDCSSLEN